MRYQPLSTFGEVFKTKLNSGELESRMSRNESIALLPLMMRGRYLCTDKTYKTLPIF